jgi:NAD(P)-dependent dehydrogenase (short-subunit alcohol dehydrogenase family)
MNRRLSPTFEGRRSCRQPTVEMFIEVVAIELGPHNICVNAIAPGLIEVPHANLIPESKLLADRCPHFRRRVLPGFHDHRIARQYRRDK